MLYAFNESGERVLELEGKAGYAGNGRGAIQFLIASVQLVKLGNASARPIS